MELQHTCAVLVVTLLFVGVFGAPTPVEEQFDNYDPVEMFEGDIAGIHLPSGASVGDVGKLMSKHGKNGIVKPDARWPSGVMPFEVSKYFNASERVKISKAVEEFAVKTAGFRLKPRTDETNYVYIARGARNTGCWSYVGLTGGRQQLNLEVQQLSGQGHCMHHGTIVHEMNHAAGFWHEQSRGDRDNHVDINWDNIDESKQHNFATYNTTVATAFGVAYDYGSLMHYAMYDFAKNRSIWTIRGKGENMATKLGNNIGLTVNDIAKLDQMYPARASTL